MIAIPVAPVRAATPEWTVHIKISTPDPQHPGNIVWDHLIAGIKDGAHEGYNSSEDSLALVEVDDPIQALFDHGIEPQDTDGNGQIDEWMCTAPEEGYTADICSLWRDIRPFNGEKVWRFKVLSLNNGGTVTLQWSFDNPLPEDIDLYLTDPSDPSISIDMKRASSYFYTNNFISPSDQYGLRTFEIHMKINTMYIIPPALPHGTVNTDYQGTFTAIGGNPVWSIGDGELPPGMSLDPNRGEISGRPLQTGTYTFTIRGYDPDSGYTVEREFTLTINSIPWIESLNVPDGVVGEEYYGMIRVDGGTRPLSWSLQGELPEGITLDSTTGIIQGVPQVSGVYEFEVAVKDANGATDSRQYRIKIIDMKDTQAPEAVKDLRASSLSDTSILLIWTAPYDDSLTGTAAIYDIRYLEGCTKASDMIWDQAREAIGEPKPQAWTLQTYTLSDLKPQVSYCIAMKSIDTGGHESPLSNVVVINPSDLNNARTGEYEGHLILNKGYNLISFPLFPVPDLVDSIFSTYMETPVTLLRWYTSSPGNVDPRYHSEEYVSPGLAYFVFSPEDNVDILLKGIKVDRDTYSIHLERGWNMIGNPYDTSIALADIIIHDESGDRTFKEAVMDGTIGNSVYFLKDGTYDFASFNDDPPATLEPWVGYWIYSDKEGVELIFNRP